MHIERRFHRKVWEWYLLLLIANGLDLLFTYFGVSHGILEEANPLLRPYILTVWPFVVKIGELALLALVIVAMLRTPQSRARFVFRTLQVVTGAYGVVLLMHLLNLVTIVIRG